MMPDIVRFYDEPMADFSSLCTKAVSRLAREHVTVALTGDGGDAFFGGYQGYLALKFFSRYAAFMPHAVRKWISKLSALLPPSQLGNLVRRSGRVDVGLFSGKFTKAGRRVDLASIMPEHQLVDLPDEEAAQFMRSRPNPPAVETAMRYD